MTFLSYRESGGKFVLPFQLDAFMSAIMQDLQVAGGEFDFLRGRALWLAAKLSKVMPSTQALPFFEVRCIGE